jgi:tripartite-type tricarboxylate transporter receptor subunit TctC
VAPVLTIRADRSTNNNRETAMITSRRRTLALLAGLPMLGTARAQSSAPYPNKPIRLIVPYPAGGQTDATARMFAQKAEAGLGQPIVVENKVGANSLIGTNFVAAAPNDGYTLLFNMTALVQNPIVLPKITYDAFRDFTPIFRAYELMAILATPPDLPVKTLADFAALAKASKMPLNYGTAGHASSSHYFGEVFARASGVTLNHIPYKGESALLPDLMAGRVQGGFVSGMAAKQMGGDGKIRLLATSGYKRLSAFPQLPTFKELGIAGIGNESFAGFFAPAGTPKTIIDRLNLEFGKVSQIPEVRERIESYGLEACPPAPPEAFLAVMRRAQDEWVGIAKTSAIKLE